MKAPYQNNDNDNQIEKTNEQKSISNASLAKMNLRKGPERGCFEFR